MLSYIGVYMYEEKKYCQRYNLKYKWPKDKNQANITNHDEQTNKQTNRLTSELTDRQNAQRNATLNDDCTINFSLNRAQLDLLFL